MNELEVKGSLPLYKQAKLRHFCPHKQSVKFCQVLNYVKALMSREFFLFIWGWGGRGGATVLKYRADPQQTKSFVYIWCSSCPKLFVCCCSALCFKTVAPSSLLFLTVPVTSLGPSPQSSTPCQPTFPCCTVCLIWLALGARKIPYVLPAIEGHWYVSMLFWQFSTLTTYILGCLQNCQNYILMYHCSPIAGRRSWKDS